MIKLNIYKERVDKIRNLMRRENIDFYLIPSDDFHASEYVGEYFKCREYVSGFDGSAGTLLISTDMAGLWTDGRYFIQAKEQLEGSDIILFRSGEENVPDIYSYIKENIKIGGCLGFDARCMTLVSANKIKKLLDEKAVSIKSDVDLVGEIWTDRPAFAPKNAWMLETKYCGKDVSQKLSELREALKKENADMILLASLDDISWLYNIRGNDIDYTPVVMCYSVVGMDSSVIYARKDVFDSDTLAMFASEKIVVKDYFQVYDDVKKIEKGTRLFIDESSVNKALGDCISNEVITVKGDNPTIMMKAVKNPTEMENERIAHIKDAVAVTKLIYKLKNELRDDIVNKRLTELDVAKMQLELRKQQDNFVMESFAPIIATGKHGAIIHYEPTYETNVAIEDNSFLLMDTGGHYLEGTTDITRTVAIGNVTDEMKKRYTAVLIGNLEIADAYFKEGISGENLDYLARHSLWQMGLDYRHGTGHGVGYLMNVHEGPNSIRLKGMPGKAPTAFCEGMITSDEPGVYIEGEYGIRLENLVMCVKDKKTEYGQFMRFETLTLVPFDMDAIDYDMLTDRHKQLLLNYHKNIYENIKEYFNEKEREWLYNFTC